MNTPFQFSGDWTLLEKVLPNVPRETLQGLVRYSDLVLSWNQKMNLTGATSLQQFFELHILDSLAALNFILPQHGIIDVGSGAGLPGIVWGIANRQLPLVLVESSLKRCSFLEKVKSELALGNIQILPKRFEMLRQEELPDCACYWSVVSRGTAAPKELLKLASRSHVEWERWYVFSNEKIHAEYLFESSSTGIIIEKGDYSKFLHQGMKSKGLLTCLQRARKQ